MGTTYQAQVEVFQPGKPQYTTEHWQPISRWELQKDYDFYTKWSEVAVEGWPEPTTQDYWDQVILIGEMPDDEYGYDLDQKMHGEGWFLVQLEIEDPSPWFLELQAHVKSLLDRGFKVRVLTWGE